MGFVLEKLTDELKTFRKLQGKKSFALCFYKSHSISLDSLYCYNKDGIQMTLVEDSLYNPRLYYRKDKNSKFYTLYADIGLNNTRTIEFKDVSPKLINDLLWVQTQWPDASSAGEK